MSNNLADKKEKQSRKKSNTLNWLLLAVGVVIIICDIVFLYKNHSCELDGWKKDMMIISPFILFWAFVTVAVSIWFIANVKSLNEQLKKSRFPYGFDYVMENAIYKVVGSSKSKIKCDGVKIEPFENYVEWKKHIIEKYRREDCVIQRDYENFYRFLIKRRRNAELRKQMLYGILLPVELGVIAVCCGSDGLFDSPVTCTLGVVVGSCLFMWKAMGEQFDNEDEINFINDFMEIMESENDSIYDDKRVALIEDIKNLKRRANQVIMQKGNEIPITLELFYFMAAVDKSIKLIDAFLYAMEKRNITVLAILTRVQMDCVFRTYALQLVDDRNKFCKEIFEEQIQLNHLKDKNGNKMSDSYLANEVGKWKGLPVYDLYQKVCGFVHFSDYNLHTMIHSIEDNSFKMTSFTEKNPEENKETFDRLSIELGEQFYLFGRILIDDLFDSWVKQCL